MDIPVPDLDKLLVVAPSVTITIICVGIGWWARGRSAGMHIEDLKNFIKFLQERDK